MKICFVVRSPYSQVVTYTTTHLAFEAHARGHKVYYTTINSLSYRDDDRVRATVVSPGPGPFANREAFLTALKGEQARREEVCLSDFDVVFLRHNPNESDGERDKGKSPVIEFGRLLKAHGVLVMNDPGGLSRAASKLYLTNFPPEIRARTLITRSPIKVKQFLHELRKPAIIKPLSGYGGQDVFFIKNAKQELNINQIISAVSKNGYIMAQEFLPAVKQGDKRILLLNGRPIFVGKQVAMYRRMSPRGDIRSNIHVGGTRKRSEYTKSEAKVVEAIQSRLVSDGLYFVGADIVGDKLLEINVFCPGGINNINELYGINVGAVVIEDLERHVRLTKSRALPPDSLVLIKAV